MASTLSTIFAMRSEQRTPVASSKPANPRCESFISTQCGSGRSTPAFRAVHLATRQRAHWWGCAGAHPRALEYAAVQPNRGDPDRHLGDAPAEVVSLTIPGCERPLPFGASSKCGLRSESLWQKTTADAGSTPAASTRDHA